MDIEVLVAFLVNRHLFLQPDDLRLGFFKLPLILEFLILGLR
jgi:hypothetical protein